MGVYSESVDAIVGLLNPDPDARWSLDAVEAWAAADAGHARAELELAVDASVQLQRWPGCFASVPAVFAARLPRAFRGGRTVEELGFNSHGFFVLLVVRNSHWRQYYTKRGLAYQNIVTEEVAW